MNGDFYDAGDHQWMLRFEEKGGKSREIPARHDLQQIIAAYLDAAGLQLAPKDSPLFRAAIARTGQLTATAIHVNDICRMMKRRLKDARCLRGCRRTPCKVADAAEVIEKKLDHC